MRVVTVSLGLAISCLSAFATGAAVPARSADHYAVVSGWPKLPVGTSLGHVAGIGVDASGNVIVFNRAENSFPRGKFEDVIPIKSPPVIGFDGKTGKVAFSWGAGLFKMPHGLRVDSRDNIWLTDIILQQVFKFSHDGQLLMKLGTADVIGCDATHFNGPTDVAVLPDGSFFVGDGYGSSRIAKFSADGHFLFAWGHCSTIPRENLLVFQAVGHAGEPGTPAAKASTAVRRPYDGSEFNTPHSLVYDPVDRYLYVADRDNSRIQVYTGDGKFVRTLQSPALGRPWAIALGQDHLLYVVDGGDLLDGPGNGLQTSFRAAIMKITTAGEIVAKWSSFGNQDGQIYWAHDIAVAPDYSVYVGDVSHGMRVQKFAPASAARSRDGETLAR